MKKIAVLVSGFSKTSYFCIETNVINIIKKLNCDVFLYIKSGNFLVSRCRASNMFHIKDIKNEKSLYVESLGDYLKDIHIVENDDDNYKKEYDFYFNNMTCPDKIKSNYERLGNLDQYLRLKKVCELMENYEIKNNFKYDYVIRLRLDILNLFNLDLNKLDKNITLFGRLCHHEITYFTKDCFFLGKRDYIVKICKEFVSYIGNINEKLFNTDWDYVIEVVFYRYIKNTFSQSDYDFVDYYVTPKMIKVNLLNHDNWKNFEFYEILKDDLRRLDYYIEIYVACLNKCDYMNYMGTKQISINEEDLQKLYDENNKFNMIKYLEI